MDKIQIKVKGITYTATYRTIPMEFGDFRVMVDKLKCEKPTDKIPLNKWQIEPYIKNKLIEPII